MHFKTTAATTSVMGHPTSKQNIASVQALRFIAAALVVCTHATLYLQDRVDPSLQIWSTGAVGVNIFFVISGFVMVISADSIRRTVQGGVLFMKRRLARIVPIYWIATSAKLAVLLILPAAALHTKTDLANTIGSFLFFPVLDGNGEVKPLHGVGWTLMHEMYFYVLFSVGMALRLSPILFSSGIILITSLMGVWLDSQAPAASVYMNTINLLFVAGMVLGVCVLRNIRLHFVPAVMITVIGSVVILTPNLRELIFVYLRNFDIGSVLIVAGVIFLNRHIHDKIPQLFLSLGESSYSLYIFHPLIGPTLAAVMVKLGVQQVAIGFLVITITAVGLCHLIYLMLEKPINRHLKRFL